MRVLYPKRFSLFLGLTLLTFFLFAFNSRYPALNEKALMGSRTPFSSIAFDQVFVIEESDSSTIRVFKNYSNWWATNYKGMLFGILLATLILSLLKTITVSKFGNSFLDSLVGGLLGAPLGVCANCAAPVGQSLFEGRASVSTAISLQMSSPSFNVIVLTMLFTSFPAEFAITKLAFSILVVFGLVPLLTGTLNKAQLPPAEVNFSRVSEEWSQSLKSSASIFSKAAGVVLIKTAPFMFLGGLVGVSIVEFLPGDFFLKSESSLLFLAFVSLVGTLLPVPIAFDIVLVGVFSMSGLSNGYQMALLLSLGITSIYPLSVIGKHISRKLALQLFLTIWFFTFVTSGIFYLFQEARETKLIEMIPQETSIVPSINLAKNFKEAKMSICKESSSKNCLKVLGAFLALSFEKEGYCEEGDRVCFFLGMDRGSIGKCAGFADESDLCERTQYEVLKYENDALSSYKICDYLKSKKLKKECSFLVEINKAVYYKDKSLCQDLSSESYKKCLFHISESKSHDCEQILPRYPSNWNWRELCLRIDALKKQVNSIIAESVSLDKSTLLKRRESSFKIKVKPSKNLVGVKKLLSFDNESENNRLFFKREEVLPNQMIPTDLIQPFLRGRGLSSGDIDNDGDLDVLVGSRQGIKLLENRNGQFLDRGQFFSSFNILYVALVDVDVDGLVDVVFSTAGRGSFLAINDVLVKRDTSRLLKIPGSEVYLTRSMSFGDLDGDGRLEVFLGNWGSIRKPHVRENSKNTIFSYSSTGWKSFSYYDPHKGSTLSSLFSDVDGDGRSDIFVAHDFEVPDRIDFTSVDKKLLKKTTFSSMSYDSGDINQDGLLDLLSVDIDFRKEEFPPDCGSDFLCKENLKALKAISNIDIDVCEEGGKFLGDCQRAVFFRLAEKRKKYCPKLKSSSPSLYYLCMRDYRDGRDYRFTGGELKQQEGENLIYIQGKDNSFATPFAGKAVSKTGWTWNAQLIDYNNDSFLDIYFANGIVDEEYYGENQLFLNERGSSFKRFKDPVLDSKAPSTSYLSEDFDGDGDIDILLYQINAPLVLFRNQLNTSSVIIRLRSDRYITVGALVTATYKSGKKVVREVKASGGYYSARSGDTHFGLVGDSITDLEIRLGTKNYRYPREFKPGLFEIWLQ